MSIRSKVAAVAVPEAAAARHLAGEKDPAKVHTELQRRRKAAAARAAARRATPEPQQQTGEPGGGGSDVAAGGATAAAPASKPAPLFTADQMSAAHTGSGVLLGAMAWVLVRAYLEGGVPGVRAFLAAKFLNKTPGGAK